MKYRHLGYVYNDVLGTYSQLREDAEGKRWIRPVMGWKRSLMKARLLALRYKKLLKLQVQ